MSPEWNATLLRVMLESSLRVCLLAAAVGGILLLGRIRSGSVRHAAWSAVLGAMILMPVLSHWVPAIDVPVPSRARRVEAIPAAIESVWFDPNEEFRDPTAPPPAPVAVASTRESVPTTPPPPRAIWPLALVGIYGAGVLFLLFRLMLGWRAVHAIVRASEPIDWGSTSQSLRSSDVRRPTSDVNDSGLRTPDTGLLCESALVATPMTVGILAPRILLPTAWKLWPDEKLRAVLAHEVAHVRRRDPLVALLARVNLCLFWFHPVAWWLEKKLATTAEHACDDVGLRVMGEKRRYAEVLLDMAEAVRRAGGRVSWDGVGVHGSGLLGQRIDRVLRGELFREVSMTRKIIVALSCAIAIVLVVACRRQAAVPAPLQEDPAFVAQQEQNKVEIDLQDGARQMTAAQVTEIEAVLQRNPEDLVARKRLLIFSLPYGVPVPGEKDKWAPRCAQVIGEQPCIALRRVQILWLIEHHPDSDVLGYTAQISPAGGNLNDPLGYAEASKLWLAQTARPDASVAVLMNAADFFERADKPLSEKMLLRVQALDPKGPGSRRLGRLYAAVAVGAASVFDRQTADAGEARGPYAQAVHKKLDESKDPRLLAEAAWWLNYAPPLAHEQDLGFDPRALAKTCAERALQMDPQFLQAHMILVSQRRAERDARMRKAVGNVPGEAQDKALSALADAERFEYLPSLATTAYSMGDYDGSRHDEAAAKTDRDRAKKYAEDLLRLAPGFRDSENYGTAVYAANLVLAGLTLREGDGREAGRYLIEASKAPVNDELRYSLPGPGLQMLGYMLKYDVRDPVVEFLERVGRFNAQGKQLLDAAAQIRKGYRPIWYPRDTRYYPGIVPG